MERRSLLAGLTAATLAPSLGAAQVTLPSPEQIKAMEAKLLADLPYPRVETTGAEALATWERLKAEGKSWPIVVGDDEDLLHIADAFSMDPDRSTATILAATAKLTYPKALNNFAKEEWGDDLSSVEVGAWPKNGAAARGFVELTAAEDLDGKPKPKVHILLLPTNDSAEAFAYLRWGGWNACPPPELHVLAARDWARRYGAEVVGICGDVVNMRVRKRPSSRKEALALAREHLAYCPDIVFQGSSDLAPLAAALMDSDWWFFWWD
jgi:hypothetical protein